MIWATLIAIMIITTGVLIRGLRHNPRASLIRLYDEKMVAANVARDKGDIVRYNKLYNDAKEVFIMIRQLDLDDRESWETHRYHR